MSKSSTSSRPASEESAAAEPGTIHARPISFAEIEHLGHRDTDAVQVYLAEVSRRHGLTLTPATLTTRPVTSRERAGEEIPHRVIHAAVVDDRPGSNTDGKVHYRADTHRPVGYEVRCDLKTPFGTAQETRLFSSEEAEDTARLVHGYTEPERGRFKVYVADAKAPEHRLTPVFGSQVTVSLIVADADPDEVRDRVEALLRAEFGDRMRPHAKILSRPVPDKRVNVYSAGPDRELLAANVLAAEVGLFMRSSAADVEEVDPQAPPIAVG